MKLRILGAHNLESRESKMATLLVDNVLAIDAGGLTSSLSLQEQSEIKALLLTHQHYDHLRDLPALAMSLSLRRSSLNVYSTLPVFNVLRSQLFDGSMYPDFFEPRAENRVLVSNEMIPYQKVQIGEYSVMAAPVVHSVPAVGFQITAAHGETVFYTGDTGPGLYETWRHVSPQVLVVEVTASNSKNDFARQSGHLTPDLLRGELLVFKELNRYLPKVVTVHMDPTLEVEIAAQIQKVAEELSEDITLAREGMELDIPRI